MQDVFQVNHLNLQSDPASSKTPTHTSSTDPQVLDPQPTDPVFNYRPQPQGVPPMRKKSSNSMFLVLSLLVILGGSATGFGVSKLQATDSSIRDSLTAEQQAARANVKNGQVFGEEEIDVKLDDTAGYLEEGGIDGEGSHKLLREGGPSQYVYLTSSKVDLDQFVGMEIKVWGETQEGQKAGWLMDAHRVEVVNTNAKPPAGAE